MPKTEFGKTMAEVKALLAHRNLTQIVWVDDEPFSDALEDALGLLQSLRTVPDTILKMFGGEPNQPLDVLADKFRVAWQQRGPDTKIAALKELREATNTPTSPHEQFVECLPMLLDVPIAQYKYLTPQEWSQQRDAIVRGSQTGDTTALGLQATNALFLFDLDLTKAGLTERGGEDLAIGLIRDFANIECLCGVISANLTPEQARAAHPVDGGVHADRLIFASKQDLGDHPETLAIAIKRALAAPYVASLRDIATTLMREAQVAASNEVAKIDLFDFFHSVVARSAEEGVTEFETLARIHRIHERDAVRRVAHSSGPLAATTRELQAINKLPVSALKQFKSNAWKIQRLEMYEDASDLALLHLPLETGDLFEIQRADGATAGQYILLSHPCELMLRKGADRELLNGVLVEIGPVAAAVDDSKQYKLLYFSPDGGSRSILFRNHRTIALLPLDLCVFGADGRSRMALDDADPALHLQPWREHYARLRLRVVEMLELLDVPEDRDLVIVPPPTAHGELVATVSANRRVLAYAIRRVGRVASPIATDALTHFSHYLSRAALNADLGRPPTRV